VLVTDGVTARSAYVVDGHATFAPITTDHLTVQFTPEPADDGDHRLFGVTDVRIPELLELEDQIPTNGFDLVSIPCGSGPSLSIGGTVIEIGVTVPRSAFAEPGPLTATPCGPVEIRIDGDTFMVEGTTPIRGLGVDAVTLVGGDWPASDSNGGSAGSGGQRSLELRASSRTERTVDVGPGVRSLLVVAMAANDGWVAALGNTPLESVTVDGWKQAFVVPAGAGGTVTLRYEPQRLYETALVAGAGVAALLLVLGVLWPLGRLGRRLMRRHRRAAEHATVGDEPLAVGVGPAADRWWGWVAAIAVAVALSPAVLAALGVVLVVRASWPRWRADRWRAPAVVAIVAAAVIGAYGAAEPIHLYRGGVYTFAAQFLATLAVCWCLVGWRPGRGPLIDLAPRHAKDRVAVLDGYRAVAAIAVVAYHVYFHSAIIPRAPFDGWEGLPDQLGNFGVAIFFVLSGWVMFRPVLDNDALDGATPVPTELRAGRFWKRRFLRVYPAYWLALAGALVAFRITPEPRELTSWLTLTHVYRGTNYVLSGLPVAWTLCVEVSFYLVLPLVVRLFWRHARRAGPRRALVALVAVFFAIAWASRLAVLAAGGEARVALAWLPAHLDWFAFGFVLAALERSWRGGHSVTRIARLARRPAVCAVATVGLLVVSGVAGLRYTLAAEPAWKLLLRAAVNGLAAFVILLPAAVNPRRGTFARLLTHPTVTFLGRISYGIYLWHVVVLTEWVRHTDVGPLGFARSSTRPLLLFVTVLSITIAIATMSYVLVERPLGRLGRRRRRADDEPPVQADTSSGDGDDRSPVAAAAST
jgi:peptidoglycan/LPS O-acetylase OafA/YrhL